MNTLELVKEYFTNVFTFIQTKKYYINHWFKTGKSAIIDIFNALTKQIKTSGLKILHFTKIIMSTITRQKKTTIYENHSCTEFKQFIKIEENILNYNLF